MKNLIMSFLSLLAVAVLPLGIPMAAVAGDESGTAQSISAGDAVDIFDGANGKVGDVANELYDAIADSATDEKTLDTLMNGLNKVGVKGGWAKQLGVLNKIKGVSEAFSDAVSALNAGKTLGELSAAYQSGDRETFRNIIADQLTDLAAGAVAKAVNYGIKAAGTAIISASALTGPGFLIASGVVLVAQWVVGDWIEKKIAEAIRDGSMYKTFQEFGDAIWNMLGGEDNDDDGGGQVCKPGDNPDPFDDTPGNGGTKSSDDGYKGINGIKLFHR